MIPMPLYDNGADLGTRADRRDYLEPMGERWPYKGARRTASALANLVLWLDVGRAARWQPRPRPNASPATYCDHYAADFCEQLLGRQVLSAWVWWTDSAIASMVATGRPVPVEYGRTVLEHGARGLYGWLEEWGADFGWREESTSAALRKAMNEGVTFGIIVTPGHIAVALPDACEGAGGLVVDYARKRPSGRPESLPDVPLQSQSGSKCVTAWRRSWWTPQEVQFYSFQGWP